MDEFGSFMHLHRAINGLSQVMLAERIGTNQSAIGQWERNETSPRLNNIVRLAVVFNVPVVEIVSLIHKRKNTGKKPMKPTKTWAIDGNLVSQKVPAKDVYKKEWVGLTFDDWAKEHDESSIDFLRGARWAEEKLKEKNA